MVLMMGKERATKRRRRNAVKSSPQETNATMGYRDSGLSSGLMARETLCTCLMTLFTELGAQCADPDDLILFTPPVKGQFGTRVGLVAGSQ
jgi:hypothetical protein